MPDPLRNLPALKKLKDKVTQIRKRSLSRGVHQALIAAFEKAGFQFELRNRGDSKIGLWRFPLTRASAQKGPKRRFVFVPGFGDTPVSWLPVLGPLAAVLATSHDELVCLDFPGFGGALADEPAFEDMEEFRSMFAETMRTLQPDILMGHSLGGWLCADYVAESATETQPRRLILADPSGMVGDAAAKEAWRQRWVDTFEHGFEKVRPHVFGVEPFWFRFLAGEFGGFLNQPEVQKFVHSIREDHLLETRLDRIRSDVSFVWGEIDTLTPTEWLALWRDAFLAAGKTTEAYLVRGAGHSIQLEKPIATLGVITQILLGKEAPKMLSNLFWQKV